MVEKFLNSKDKNKVFQVLKRDYGLNIQVCKSLFNESAFMLSNKLKLYMFSNAKHLDSLLSIKGFKIKINSIGLYFASLSFNNDAQRKHFIGKLNISKINDFNLRPSIEGSSIIARFASKNIVMLSSEQAMQWMQGLDIVLTKQQAELITCKHPLLLFKNHALGSGIFVRKQETFKILNHVPKHRRVLQQRFLNNFFNVKFLTLS
ncbi:hypothetical protein J7L02_04340 [Candidatus Woesearchaeota archaeon]|nr:hypothetical protein [Candidatus Woesearchaeota archaeon]